jgi:acetyl esterase/lipase
MYLEIPITIYTPTEVNKDKLGIYFHGGGMMINKYV